MNLKKWAFVSFALLSFIIGLSIPLLGVPSKFDTKINQAIISNYQNRTAQPKITTILWDVDHVLIQPNRWKMTKAFLSSNHTWGALKNTNLKLLRKMRKMKNSQKKSGQSFLDLAREQNNPHLAELINEISSKKDIIPGMLAVVTELRANGYQNHIGTNNGKESFAQLQKRHPGFFSSSLFGLDKSQFAEFTNNSSLAKPNLEFFTHYLTKNSIDPKTVVFIDDKIENVLAARKVGMYAIHFKNPKQLRSDLKKLGVKINP